MQMYSRMLVAGSLLLGLGAWTMAAAVAPDSAEAARLRAETSRHAGRLERLLLAEHTGAPTA